MQNNENKSLEPVKALSQNATAYFDKLFAKHRQNMACGAGCSKCCEVEGLTVHESEAMVIWEWFNNLEQPTKLELQNIWRAKQGNNEKACVFLVDKRCSVYDARPIICRTQGAPLRFKVSDDEVGVDACPLNYTKPEQFPAQAEWLDLDRLNTLLAIAEQSYQKQTTERPLQSLLNKQSRVSLNSLRKFLLNQS